MNLWAESEEGYLARCHFFPFFFFSLTPVLSSVCRNPWLPPWEWWVNLNCKSIRGDMNFALQLEKWNETWLFFMICVGSPKNTLNATPYFFSLSCLCSIITASLENKSRDNWFVGLRWSLFSRVIIRQLHYGWRRRNPSLAFTNIYREDVGREGGKKCGSV